MFISLQHLTLNIGGDLLAEVAEEGLGKLLRRFKVEVGFLAQEESVEFFPVVEGEALV